MESIAQSQPKNHLEKMQGRLIRQLAETHCQIEALYGYSKRDLAVVQLDKEGRLKQDKITDLQLQAELVSNHLSALMRLNLTITALVGEIRAANRAESEVLGSVAVFPLALIPQGNG